VEAFSFLHHIGDLRGKSVLDLACGEGFYSRIFKSRGAAEVTGIDLSEKMVELARKQEHLEPLGIRYRTGDAKSVRTNEQYDLVAAAYLLNYATCIDDLQAMVASISGFLKPGGRFVSVNSNPGLDFTKAPSYRKYGFETEVSGAWNEGVPIQWKFHLDDTVVQVENYFLSIATHEAAFKSAGLQSVRWHSPTLSAEGRSQFGDDYWSDLISHPPLACVECRK
jgi:ubiquinone/menaquinone biosynthesis C-methylase UbiE